MKSVSDEELNIRKIKPILLRNKKLIIIFSIFGFVFGSLNAFISRNQEIWRGEFQIVMDSGESASSSNFSQIPQGISELIGTEDKEETDVKILQSPFVLMEIFEFIKDQKSLNGDKSLAKTDFKTWRKKHILIDTEPSTSILNVEYKDPDKSLVIPVLNKISTKFQKYTNDKRERSLSRSIKFFEDQINLYKEKSKTSTRASQSFALKHNISGGFTNTIVERPDLQNYIQGVNLSHNGLLPVINVEKVRVESIEELNFIEEQLKVVKKLKNTKNYDQFVYLANSIKSKEIELLELIKDLDLEITEARMFYKEEDKIVKDLLYEKEDKLNLLVEKIEKELQANKTLTQSRIDASKRPEEVIIKYKELLSDAYKNSLALDQFENNYRLLMLEKAREENPWQLITQPTLFPIPLKPNPIKLLIISTLLGIIGGIIISSLIELKKNNIFFLEEIEKITELPLIVNLLLDKDKSFKDSLDLLKQVPIFNEFDKLTILETGLIDEILIDQLKNKLKELFNTEISFTKNINEAFENNNIVLLTLEGGVKPQELLEIKQKIITYNKNGLGFILLSNG